MTPVDAVVVGGGIVGLATALALIERHGARVVVLEAEDRIAAHQTGRNSGVLHAGLYYQPGSQKATLCRAGLQAMYRFCDAEGVNHRRTGKLIVATTDLELGRLGDLENNARANGVAVRRVASSALSEIEPHVAGLGGLWVEESGVVDFGEVAAAMARRMTRLGGEIRFGARAVGVRRDGGGFAVETTKGVILARRLVGSAGLQADRVARLSGLKPSVRIVPFRGEYYDLLPARATLVRGLIYPVPDPRLPFLGVHLTRRMDGVVEAGPNAVLSLARHGYRRGSVSLRDIGEWVAYPGFWRLARRHWRSGLDEWWRSRSRSRFVASLRRLVPAISQNDVVYSRAGVRPQAVAPDGTMIGDFVFAEGKGMVHVINAPSPAATASLAIGELIADRVMKAG